MSRNLVQTDLFRSDLKRHWLLTSHPVCRIWKSVGTNFIHVLSRERVDVRVLLQKKCSDISRIT